MALMTCCAAPRQISRTRLISRSSLSLSRSLRAHTRSSKTAKRTGPPFGGQSIKTMNSQNTNLSHVSLWENYFRLSLSVVSHRSRSPLLGCCCSLFYFLFLFWALAHATHVRPMHIKYNVTVAGMTLTWCSMCFVSTSDGGVSKWRWWCWWQ